MGIRTEKRKSQGDQLEVSIVFLVFRWKKGRFYRKFSTNLLFLVIFSIFSPEFLYFNKRENKKKKALGRFKHAIIAYFSYLYAQKCLFSLFYPELQEAVVFSHAFSYHFLMFEKRRARKTVKLSRRIYR